MNAKKLVVALTLSLIGGWAAAAVEVRFINPEKFVDIDDANFRPQDEALKGIQAHLRELGDKGLPGDDLMIDVTDVDLAGRVEPHGPRMDMVRVMRETGSPSIKLHYVLSKGGVELRHGDVRMVDLDYLHGINRYPSDDPLRFEKRMMDTWFQREFGADTQQVGRNK